MWLSVATWRDIYFHIVQANKYTAFIKNPGKGLKDTSYLHAKKNWHMTDLECEVEYDGSQDDFFVSYRKPKHRAPKPFSDSNPQQKQGKKRKMETSDEESSEDDPQVNMGIERVPQEKEQEHMRSNPLALTPITGRVRICTGCKVLFTDREQKQPHDLVFRMQMRRQYQKVGKKKTALKKSNVLPHEGFGLCAPNNRICIFWTWPHIHSK